MTLGAAASAGVRLIVCARNAVIRSSQTPDRHVGHRAYSERKAVTSGYDSADNNEVIGPQIPAQSPSDRSNVTTKDASISDR
jgi:hypothetical protein